MTDNSEELVDWVNPDGSVIEVVNRKRMRTENLRHRATYIAVIDSEGNLIVHQRADWKEVYPGWWDLAFGGVCAAGEDWVVSANRELFEESGISGQTLHPLGEVAYDGPDGAVVGRAFVVRWDSEIIFNDGEVVAIDKVPLADLDLWMEGRLVCLDSREALPSLLRDYAHAQGYTRP